MVSNIFATAAALASAVPLVFGAAVLPQAQDSESSIFARQTSWDDYHQQNSIFAEQGICRYYIDPTDRDGLWPCRQYCNSDSVTCNANANDDPSTIGTNPNGERYTYGECWCSNPALDILVELTAEGMQDLPAITCAVWLQALKESVKLGTWAIPGVGPAAKAAKSLVKVVKRADKVLGKERWNNFIKDTCHVEEWDFDIGKAFDLFKEGDES